MLDISAAVHGYLTAQLWAGVDPETDEPYDARYDVDDFDPAYVDQVRREFEDIADLHSDDVDAFVESTDYRNVYGYDRSELFGHDFLLTRDGHGAGFWDRGLGDLGERLTEVARTYGESTPLWVDGTGTLVAAF